MYHVHNVDRMSLEQRAKDKAEKYLAEHPELKKLKREELKGENGDLKYLEFLSNMQKP